MKYLVRKAFSALSVFAVVLGTLSLSGVALADSSDFPNKPISIIVAYDAGGGTDTTARTLAPFLEDELGVPINVINRPGGAGWVGWVKLANSDPDGYTIGYLNSPNIASGLVNPNMDRMVGLDSYDMIGNDVADPGAVVIRVDETRFSNFQELVDYAQDHDLTTTATGVAGDDHLVTLKMNHKLGTQFRAIQFEGTADSRSSFLGAHVDVLVTSVGEAYTLHNNGQVKVVAITAEERSPFLPDVPTVGEVTGETIISASTRGLVAPKGVSPDRLKILRDAVAHAVNNADHMARMEKLGIQVLYKNGKEYAELLQQDVAGIQQLKGLLGW